VENEVRRQREWLRVTLASIGDAVLTTDLQGRITLLNPAAERLTGWVESEALGRPAGDVFRIINEQSRKPAEDIIGRTLREGNVAWLGPHTILVSRNGTEYPIEDSAAPILAEGVVSGVVVVFHDVSERLRTQRTLQSSQAQLHTVLDTLTEGLVVSTLDGEVILWNRSGLEMHGYASLKEALGHLADFGRAFELATMEGKVLPVDEWPLARILRGELLRDVELRVRRLDMDLHRVVSFGGALARDPDGKPLMAVVSLRDITAKKRDEQALRESESRMRALGDNLPEGAVFRYIQDRAGATRFEFISAGIESIGGVSREEAMRDAALALDTIVPEDRLRYLEAAQTSRQELTRFELEIRIRNRKTGEVHWCLIRSEPRQSPDGVVWDGVLLDVTARKGLEEQLRQRVEELEALMDVAPVAVWSAQDPACLEITGNRMANAFYDADAGENVSATTTPVRRFFQNGRELLPDELPMQQAAALNCEVRGSEVEVLLPSGRRLHILGHASPLHDMTGRVRGCVGAFLDITERKHAEERLRRSEAMYRAVARSLPDGGVAVVDMDLRLVVLEGSLLARIGIEAGSFEGRQVEEAIDATRAALASPVFYRRALAGESIANETSYAGRILSCRHAPLRDEQGVVIGAMSLFLDVTERRRSEEQFRQAQKLESIGLLAGGVAHDFNNLLTAIMGNASLMAEDALPTQSELLDGIINSAGKAAHLTRQLLAYSGKGQFLVKNLNLTHCLVEMRDLIRLSVPKSVELRFNTREQLPLVSMDPGQFQQIAMNLIINAGEAIGEGCRGTISIATGLFDAERPFRDAVGEEIAAGRYVYLQVEDTGPGMDEATKLRIFDPFFTTKFTGRGLGLAAVSGIVRSQRGAISVESTVRKGSVFRVLFSGLHSGMHEADHEPAPVRGRAVLVVDDEEAVRRFLVMALRKHGYQVHQAADGREALALFDRLEERVDAVVLDIVMPVMGASDFIPEIKQRRPDLKVLLTSGYNESEAKRLCSAYEGSAFIQKPYTAQQLAAAIEKLLDADERS
jgi:PAS domain S-box-containing protein